MYPPTDQLISAPRLVNSDIAPKIAYQRVSALSPASRSSRLRFRNLSYSQSSRAKTLTTRMPLSDSFKCMCKRAHFWPTL